MQYSPNVADQFKRILRLRVKMVMRRLTLPYMEELETKKNPLRKDVECVLVGILEGLAYGRGRIYSLKRAELSG
jgi:hypothetical protein